MYQVRPAGMADIPALVAYRRAMFEGMGYCDDAAQSAMEAASAAYLAEALPAGQFHGWMAEAGGEPIACGGLVVHIVPPSPLNLAGREGYIMNLYTRPEWRGRGVATAILRAILDWLRVEGVPLATLRASEAGRPLYEREGFEPSNEMRLRLSRSCT
jgi:GNAT superfamily N-acetyltransferase